MRFFYLIKPETLFLPSWDDGVRCAGKVGLEINVLGALFLN